jgi:hypothetical protein
MLMLLGEWYVCAQDQGYRKLPPPPRFEAPKLDPGGCVLEAPSEARLNFLKRASGLLSAIPGISEASPSEARSRNLEARFGGRFIGTSEEGPHASKGE